MLVRDEVTRLMPLLDFYRERLTGRKAVIYGRRVQDDLADQGAAFDRHRDGRLRLPDRPARRLRDHGRPQPRHDHRGRLQPGRAQHLRPRARSADLFIGGVKERPIAFKMGMAFCDHNHERKLPLAGYEA